LPRPLEAPLAAVLAVCAVAIRGRVLALGAHYATDVLGGLLLGAAWLCLALPDAALGAYSVSMISISRG